MIELTLIELPPLDLLNFMKGKLLNGNIHFFQKLPGGHVR